MKLAITRDSLRATPQPKLLWAAEFLGNPLLFLGFWLWLLIPEASGAQIFGSLLVAAVVGVAFLTLAGATLSWYVDHHAGETPTLKSVFLKGLKHFLWIAIWALAALAVLKLVDWAGGYEYQMPTYVRSKMSSGMRNHITEEGLHSFFNFVLAVVTWVLLPALWLPPAAQLAARGLRGFAREGFRAWGRSLASWQYWVLVIVCAFVGVWLPGKVMDWIPKAGTPLRLETYSMLARLLLSYLLALMAWMLLASTVGRAGAPAQKKD
jgi:hypothetical protein